MHKTFHKTNPFIPLNDFLEKAHTVSAFTSSNGKRYIVMRIIENEMFFRRLDAKKDLEWSMNLNQVFLAYQELHNFATINFRPYVPITHSPARGLLVHLGMLA
jgi:hypothetical protein